MKSHILLIFTALSLASCTKVIDLDLNNADTRLVIEAEISDQQGPYYVKISQTLNFDEPNNWPTVSGATVILSETGGAVDTLQEVSPGLYASAHIQGVPGHTYDLQVTVDGQTHSAVSTMPQPVALDTAYTQVGAAMGGEQTIPVLEFFDPAGVKNYYNFTVKRDGFQLPGFFTVDDNVRDGSRVIRPLRSSGFNLKTGDELAVELQCVEAAVYDYFYVLEKAAGMGLSQSPTPSNPTGNFDTNALGYFSAHTSSIRKITVK
jgi:hypothetical protein